MAAQRQDNRASYEGLEVADLFTFFTEKAWDVADITGSFQLLKERLGVTGEYGLDLYRSLKSKLTHWKAKTLWELLDKKVQLNEYMQQKACQGMRVGVVGCGPVGMRFAIEAALLGCDVYVVDKRKYFSRNNVLHLWPFTIDDLKRLGAKKFYGQFCAGAIDHISIRSLQSVLLKTSLMLGVKIFFNVEFIKIKEPANGRGWHAEFTPANHLLNEIDFKVLVGAEGKNSRIPGFDRKELRAKLALAITANFVNHRTQEEAAVQEISGVAFIFNQKFFKDLREDTGIDLENLVYYKDDTHYFIMTAKKDSLLEKGVLRQDFADVQQLLAPSNRNVKAMCDYACEAAGWSTELPHLDFAVNHKGQNDVDLFDFTSIYQAEYAAKAFRRGGEDLLVCLVGDSLVQPFWPQGTGCARGFLSAMDAAWMIRGFGQGRGVLELLAERESLFQRLTQTKPDSLMKKFAAYTIDPRTRYPNLNITIVKPNMVKKLYDCDGDFPLEIQTPSVPEVPNNVHQKENAPPTEVSAIVTPPRSLTKSSEPRPKPPLLKTPSRPINEAGHITRALYGTPEEEAKIVDRQVLLRWFQDEMKEYPSRRVNDLSRSFRDGLVLCALIHRYNPNIIPHYPQLTTADPLSNNKLAFSSLEKHFGIPQLIKPSEMDRPDRLGLFTYLSSVYETFQNLELPEKTEEATPTAAPKKSLSRKLSRKSSKTLLKPTTPTDSWNTQTSSLRRSLSPQKPLRAKDRRSSKSGGKLPDLAEKSNSPSSPPHQATPETAPLRKTVVSKEPTPSNVPKQATTNATPVRPSNSQAKSGDAKAKRISTFGAPTVASDICFFCEKKVFLMERMSANGVFFHRHCFRCSHCNMQLNMGNFAMSKADSGQPGKFFCKPHYRQLFMANPEAINYARSQPEKQSPAPLSPPAQVLTSSLEIIEEDEVSSPKLTVTLEGVSADEEEEVEARERKRTLTQRFSDFWRRRSRSNSKSASPENTSTPKKPDVEEPILYEAPPTPPSPASPPTSWMSPVTSPPTSPPPTSPPPTSSPPTSRLPTSRVPSSPKVIVSSFDDEQPFRERSPPVLLGRPGTTPPPRGDGSFLSTGIGKKGRGQTSIVRPLLTVEDEDEIALEERQKRQERFREAQSIQREMSQIELQYEELEEIAREIEQNLRDAEGTEQESNFMKAWLNLVSERNSLVRRTAELSLQMKSLELEDRQYELEKEMRDLQDNTEVPIDNNYFDKLLKELVEVVDERDNIIQQVDMDRIRELEEEEAQENMMNERFGDESPSRGRRSSTKSEGAIELRKDKKEKRTSWWPW